MSARIHALLSSARIANLPGVLGNVWLGAAIAITTDGTSASWNHERSSVLACVVGAAVCLYLAGNLLNDWRDRDWDTRHRPERALPRGWFLPRSYLTAACVLAVCGVFLAGIAGPAALAAAAAILVGIAAYTAWHKQSAWHVAWLGLCRALLPVMGAIAAGASWPDAKSLAAATIALLLYIISLSLAARGESAIPPQRHGPLLPAMLVLPVLVLLLTRPPATTSLITLVGVLPYAMWMRHCLRWRKNHQSPPVAKLLAGIPLVDWMFLLPLALADGSSAITQPTPMLCLLLPPAAFAASRLLQQRSAAT